MSDTTTTTTRTYLVEQIEREMRRQGVTQTALADRVGLTQSNLNRLLRGRSEPRAETLEALARALGYQWTLTPHISDAAKKMSRSA